MSVVWIADLRPCACAGKTQQYLRDDLPLRLLVMSATIDAEAVSRLAGRCTDDQQSGAPVSCGHTLSVRCGGQFSSPGWFRSSCKPWRRGGASQLGSCQVSPKSAGCRTQLRSPAEGRSGTYWLTPLHGELDLAPSGRRKQSGRARPAQDRAWRPPFSADLVDYRRYSRGH